MFPVKVKAWFVIGGSGSVVNPTPTQVPATLPMPAKSASTVLPSGEVSRRTVPPWPLVTVPS